MAELKKFDLEFVFPMHCSGQNFIDLAKQELPEKLVLCGTGSSFTSRSPHKAAPDLSSHGGRVARQIWPSIN